jgi:molecular chaperone GrpE
MWNEDRADAQQASEHETNTSDVPSGAERPENEMAVLVDRLKRLQAEFDNYRKRVDRDMQQSRERAADSVLIDILPVYDNLQRAFANHTGDEDPASFVEGMERIFAQLDNVLKQRGIAPIDGVGSAFDPALHEALLSVPSEEPKNVILEEFERGYLRGDRVLRPSKVKVSQGKTEPKEDSE